MIAPVYSPGEGRCASCRYIVDRKQDMILSGGQNIFPVNIAVVMREPPAVGLAYRQQLHIEDQGSVWRDRTGIAVRAIGQVGGNPQLAFAADLHSEDAFVPPLDDGGIAERRHLKWRFADRAIELLSVGQPAG